MQFTFFQRSERHPVLGTLRLDKALNWLAGTVPGTSPPVRLYLSLDDCEDRAPLFNAATELVGDLVSWRERVEAFAVARLLPLKNESWLEEGAPKVTAEQFRSHMRLQSLTVYQDGAFEFLHTDGDLFLGHSIQVTGSLTAGPEDADIPG